MKKAELILIVSFATIILAESAFGHANYIGYSGAPGASGRCASSCHGSGGGTIQIAGFPAAYIPGHAYTITISHNGGSTIRQFNSSCRIGTGSQNAGTIATGTNTVVYNTTGETNGIHLSTTSLDNATFQWTAPVSGTGTVKLYFAGHQGSTSGANTDITLTATEQATGIDDQPVIPNDFAVLNNYPNPFNPRTTIHFEMPQAGHITLDIYDVQGKKVAALYKGFSEAGKHDISWNASAQPSGIYFCRLVTDGESLSKIITLLK
jgi:hypothetical protein